MDLKRAVMGGHMQRATVLIAGAGPTGLALACYLRSRGIDAQVIDKFERPATTTRALGVQPRGRQILERLAALGDLAKEAIPQTKFDIYVDGRNIVNIDLDTLGTSSTNTVLRVPQTAIERCLRERLQELGAQVAWGHEVIAASENTGASGVAVTVRTNEGERVIQADWLIGCDGAHSAVRKVIGATFEGSIFPGTFFLGDVHMDWGKEGKAAIYLRGRQILTMASLPDGQWRIGVALPPGDPLTDTGREAMTAARDKSAVSLQDGLVRLQEIFSAYSGDKTTRLYDPTWFSVVRIHRRMASTFRRGHILIAGDAAHLTSPLGGQGMNTGLNDAFNLGWKLALVIQGVANDSLLDTYEQERRPAMEKVDKATTQWTKALFADNARSLFFRRYVVLPAMQIKKFQRWVLTGRAALQTNYRGGPLARQVSSHWLMRWWDRLACRGPQPGDLGPDAICRLEGNMEHTTLGQQIGAKWGLLFFGGADGDVDACVTAVRERFGDDVRVLSCRRSLDLGRHDIVDDFQGEIARAYRPGKSTAILLRPDGHVGWRSKRPDATALGAWIDGMLNASKSNITGEPR